MNYKNNVIENLTAEQKALFMEGSAFGRQLSEFTRNLEGTDDERFRNEFLDHVNSMVDLLSSILSLSKGGDVDETEMDEFISIARTAVEL